MINRGTFDRIEDAIDQFEEIWSPDSQSQIEDLLTEFGLISDDEAIVELIRIDIELRYERGLSIELNDYLNRFAILQDRPERVAEIAFEDYRSRSANGCPVSVSRWRGLPGVNREHWYQELARDSSARQTRARIARLQADSSTDAAFEHALEESGFHLVHEIGEGAFSRVYLANQVDLADRFVVLKIVSEPLAEPEYMALLQHTNIVPIYSFHRILSRSVICMPYAGCVTLNDFLKSRMDVSQRGGQSLIKTVRDHIGDTKLISSDESIVDAAPERFRMVPAAEEGAVMRPLETFKSLDCYQLAIWIFQRLAGALAHAHARGVLHNDLKPSNVLIRNDGEPALLDFNLSRSLGQTRFRHAGGTLPYMSPETFRVLMGQEAHPGAASDVYSLGVMLFEFVTARLPYPVPTSIAAVDLAPAIEARKGKPDWRSEDSITPGLRSVIDRCLHFNPEDRYGSADELQLDLQREQQSLPLVHTAEPAAWKLKKWVNRNPRAIASGWIAFLLLVVVVPLSWLAFAEHRSNRSLVALAEYKAFSEQSVGFLSSLMADPNRQSESNIQSGVAILRKYGLLDRNGIERLLRPHDGERQQLAREELERHITHLAILETQRLSALRISDPEASRDFERLDPLIKAAEFANDGKPSRSILFLQAERARLSQNEERYLVLQAMADKIPAKTDSELYLEAVRKLGTYDHVGASELLAALADRNRIPSALRWTMLGRAQYADRKYEDAKLSFTQSITRAPDSAPLLVMRGRCHLELGELKRAEEDYREAIRINRNSVGGWSQLGFLLYTKKQYEEALQCFDRSLELAPERIYSRLMRFQTYQAQGRHELAESEFKDAMSVECQDADQLVYRARAQWRRWNPSEPNASAIAEAVIADFQKAHELDPDRPYPLQEIARVMDVGLGKHEEAIKIFSKVLEIQPQNEIVLINRALAEMRIGRIGEALEDVQAAMAEPNSGKTLYQAACVHALIGRESNKRRAVTLLAKAIAQGYKPKNLNSDSDLDSIRDIEEFQVINTFYQTSQRDQRMRKKTGSEDEPDLDDAIPREYQPL